jgi:UDP-N-acetyl-D-glucosamine dehydrogenase
MLKSTLKNSKKKKTRIEVIGLGYVGLPLAIRLAFHGWQVTGIDIDEERISLLENHHLHETEKNLKNHFEEARKKGFLSFAKKPRKVNISKIGIICVPTPIPNSDIKSDMHVKNAVKNFLDTSKEGDIVLIESSVEIGTTENLQKFIESKNFSIGKNYGLAFCPERIDPQNKEWKLENIPRIIYCSDDTTFQICKNLYFDVNQANIIRVNSPKVPEVVKSFENTYRLVNISLVNELAILCEKLGVDAGEVINAASTKPFGYRPFYTGAGAGGHCIPKDPIFLLESSKKFGIEFKAIKDAIDINSFIPKHIVDSVKKILTEKNLPHSIIVCGMTYKHDLEDMRDSPGFKLYREFENNGFQVSAYDPFYKKSLQKKYLLENNLKKFQINLLSELSNKSIKGFSCICIVQHHKKYKSILKKIYQSSSIPFIYDCQNKIKKISSSKTILKSFGNLQD